MRLADHKSRHSVGKANEISEYDQSVSVAVIQKLGPILQKCKIKVIHRSANENRDVSEPDIQAPH